MPKDRKTRCDAGWAGLIAVLAVALVLGPSSLFAAEPDPGVPPQEAAAKPPAKTAKKSAKTAPKAAAKKPADAGPQGPKAPPIIGRRDPFKLPGPPVPAAEGANDALLYGNLPPGTRGLVISRLRLEGIVRLDTTSTMIAVVDTNSNRAYFLRENDAVYNGIVAKITPDSVTFRENTLDSAGKVGSRDVVLRLTQGPGA